ncbi:MAG TPA: M56 family metallopeptidase [Terriglobales bacterium]|nr:M56 family metallopeptidase [Terriglobales bacterium]
MTIAFNLHAFAQISAERMLNCVAAGLAIALFAWILLRLIGRRNSGTRFAVWFCALLAIAVSPLLEIGSPSRTALIHSPTAAITMPGSWASYLFGAWALIALLGLLRVAAGLWHLRTIRRSCAPIGLQNLDLMLRRTLAEFRSVRPVELCVSDELRVPTAIGFAKPAVVLPAWAWRELSTAELNTVLLHELAHLRRWDDWTNLAQKILRALFFFHPAVWWVESRLALEREMACDDIVLGQTANPRAYAQCLVSLAEKNLLRRGVALAQAAVGGMRQTSLRILRILDARRSPAVQVWKPAPWVVGAFSLVCLVSSAHSPKLVAFVDAVPGMAAPSARIATPATPTESPRAMTATVVPASYVEHSSSAGAHRPSAKPSVAAVVARRGRPTRNPPAPALVRTGAPSSIQAPAYQQAMFVILEGQRYGQAGPVLWQVCIWRFTVDPQGSPHVVEEIFSKSI